MSSPIKIEGVGAAPTRLAHIPCKDIRENLVMLRPVDRENPEFIMLQDSVKKNGVITPISVREIPDPGDQSKTLYGLVDGLQRWTSAKDAGHETIPAHVITVADGDVLEAQILANIHKVETRPVEYSKALKTYLGSNFTMTLRELANRLSQSESWVSQRLSLTNLGDDVAELVNEGKIGLANAYSMTQLPKDVQSQHIERAMTENSQVFAPSMKKLAQEIRTAKRQGRDVEHKFSPQIRLQKVSEITDEQKNPVLVKSLLMNSNITDPLEAAKLALAWVLHIDPVSIAADQAKWDARQAEQEVNKEKRKAERQAKKQAEAEAAQNGVVKL